MASPTPNTSLSLSARLVTYLGPPSVILLTGFGSPKTALLSSIAFIPTGVFFDNWHRRTRGRGISSSGSDSKHVVTASRYGELEPMVWIYAATATLGVPASVVLQLGLGTGFAALFFGDGKRAVIKEFLRPAVDGLTPAQIAYRASVAGSWPYWGFLASISFFAMGLGEEALKYLPVMWARRRERERERLAEGSSKDKTKKPAVRRDRAYVDYAVASGLAFGVIENIGYIHAACKQEHASVASIAVMFLGRVTFGAVGHALMASLSALRATRRDFGDEQLGFLGPIGPAVLIHGLFDFIAFGACALDGNVGWIHPTGFWKVTTLYGLATSMFMGTAWLVKQQ
jgi:RsiW-degrading membrane proteinase PrsW (M82 family)